MSHSAENDAPSRKPWCLCDPGTGPHDADCPAHLAYEAARVIPPERGSHE